MIPLIIAVARGLAGALGKKAVKKLAKKAAKSQESKKPSDEKFKIEGKDLRKENRVKEAQEVSEQKKDSQSEESISSNKKLQEKSNAKISTIENKIYSLEEKIKIEENDEPSEKLVTIEKDQLEVLKDQLAIQKEQLEEQKEAEYRVEHDRKTTLKEKAKAMAKGAGKAMGNGVGKVVQKAKDNKGFLGKLMGAAAMIAMFWPQIKEKLGAFVEWVAENIPGILKDVWKKITDMAEGLMDMVIEYGPGLLKNVINGLGTMAESLLKGIVKYGPTVITMLIDGVKLIAEKALFFITEYGPKIVSMLYEGVKKMGAAAIELIVEYGPKLWEMAVNGLTVLATDVMNMITEYGPVAWDMLVNGMTKLIKWEMDMIAKYAPIAWDMLVNGLSDLANWTMDKISEYGPTVWKTVVEGVTALGSWVADKASEFGSTIWEGIKEKFSQLKDWVFDAIGNIWDNIQDFIYDKTGGMFGTQKLEEDEKIELKQEMSKTKFSRDSDDFRDQLSKLGILDKELTTKDEIENKAKLELLPIYQLRRLASADFLDEEGKQMARDAIVKAKDAQKKERKQAANLSKVKKEKAASKEKARFEALSPSEQKLEVIQKKDEKKGNIEKQQNVWKEQIERINKSGAKGPNKEKAVKHFEDLISKLDDKLDDLNSTEDSNQENSYTLADGKGGKVKISKEQNDRFNEIQDKLSEAFGDQEKFDSLLEEQEKLRAEIVKEANDKKTGTNLKDAKQVKSAAEELGLSQYENGGWTGKGKNDEVAGLVHKNEFVLTPDMLAELGAATSEDEKTKTIKKLTDGKGPEAEENLRKLLEERKEGQEKSKDTFNINGKEYKDLTKAQARDIKEGHEKSMMADPMDFDKAEALDNKMNKLLQSISDGTYVDNNATVSYSIQKPKAKAEVKPNLANTSKSIGSSSDLLTDGGTTFTPEPVPVKATIPSVSANDTKPAPKSVNDIKEGDIFKGKKLKNMNKDVEHNVKAMGYEYKEKFGEKMQLNSTGRSMKEQRKLYDAMLKKNGGKSDGSVARPGGSMHNYGLAIDSQSVQLNKAEDSGIMAKYGFHRNVHKSNGDLETWHMEPSTLSKADRSAIRAAGKKADSQGEDVDKMSKEGNFKALKGKLTKLDSDGNPIGTKKPEVSKEGPVAGKEVSEVLAPVKTDIDEPIVKPVYVKKDFDTSTEVGQKRKERYDTRFDIVPQRFEQYKSQLSELNSMGNLDKDQLERKKSLEEDLIKFPDLIGRIDEGKTTAEDDSFASKLVKDKDGNGDVSMAESTYAVTRDGTETMMQGIQSLMNMFTGSGVGGIAEEGINGLLDGVGFGNDLKGESEIQGEKNIGDRFKSAASGVGSSATGMLGMLGGGITNSLGMSNLVRKTDDENITGKKSLLGFQEEKVLAEPIKVDKPSLLEKPKEVTKEVVNTPENIEKSKTKSQEMTDKMAKLREAKKKPVEAEEMKEAVAEVITSKEVMEFKPKAEQGDELVQSAMCCCNSSEDDRVTFKESQESMKKANGTLSDKKKGASSLIAKKDSDIIKDPKKAKPKAKKKDFEIPKKESVQEFTKEAANDTTVSEKKPKKEKVKAGKSPADDMTFIDKDGKKGEAGKEYSLTELLKIQTPDEKAGNINPLTGNRFYGKGLTFSPDGAPIINGEEMNSNGKALPKQKKETLVDVAKSPGSLGDVAIAGLNGLLDGVGFGDDLKGESELQGEKAWGDRAGELGNNMLSSGKGLVGSIGGGIANSLGLGKMMGGAGAALAGSGAGSSMMEAGKAGASKVKSGASNLWEKTKGLGSSLFGSKKDKEEAPAEIATKAEIATEIPKAANETSLELRKVKNTGESLKKTSIAPDNIELKNKREGKAQDVGKATREMAAKTVEKKAQQQQGNTVVNNITQGGGSEPVPELTLSNTDVRSQDSVMIGTLF